MRQSFGLDDVSNQNILQSDISFNKVRSFLSFLLVSNVIEITNVV